MARLGMVYTIWSFENKLLSEAAKAQGAELERICDNDFILNATALNPPEYDAVLQRSVSFARTLYTTKFFENAGVNVVNSFAAHALCGDKLFCSMALAKAGVPTPKTLAAFTAESVMKAVESLGYPVVIKPVNGSWARMVSKLNDKEAVQAVLEVRETLGSPQHKVYYLQEHVEKPGRDIRAIVVGGEVMAAIYRVAKQGEWVTNVARGGEAQSCPITQELSEVCLKACGIAGEGVYGVDLMEDEGALLVHEINHTPEFRGATAATGVDIAGKMVSYLMEVAKR